MARNDKRIDQLKPSANALKSTDLFAMYSDNRTEKQSLSNVIDYLQSTINTSYFTGGTINGETIFTDVVSACTSTVYINTLSPCGGAGSTMDFQGSLNVSGNLDVTGNILSGGTDLTDIFSNLDFDISGGGTITGTTIYNGDVYFNSYIYLSSGTSVSQLVVSGDTILNSNTTINNLTVTGTSTFNNTTTFNSTSNFNNVTNFTSGVTINNLTVTGSTTFSGPLSACTEGIYVNDIYTCNSGVTVNSNLTYIGQANNPVYNSGTGTTFTLDFDNSNIQTVTLTGNTTMNNPLNVKDGAIYTVIIKQGSTTGTINSWGSNFKFEFGTTPTLTTTTGAVDIMTFVSDDVGNLYGITAFDFQ